MKNLHKILMLSASFNAGFAMGMDQDTKSVVYTGTALASAVISTNLLMGSAATCSASLLSLPCALPVAAGIAAAGVGVVAADAAAHTIIGAPYDALRLYASPYNILIERSLTYADCLKISQCGYELLDTLEEVDNATRTYFLSTIPAGYRDLFRPTELQFLTDVIPLLRDNQALQIQRRRCELVYPAEAVAIRLARFTNLRDRHDHDGRGFTYAERQQLMRLVAAMNQTARQAGMQQVIRGFVGAAAAAFGMVAGNRQVINAGVARIQDVVRVEGNVQDRPDIAGRVNQILDYAPAVIAHIPAVIAHIPAMVAQIPAILNQLQFNVVPHLQALLAGGGANANGLIAAERNMLGAMPFLANVYTNGIVDQAGVLLMPIAESRLLIVGNVQLMNPAFVAYVTSQQFHIDRVAQPGQTVEQIILAQFPA